jgi:hypothetical protein
MTTSRREQILSYAATALAGTVDVGSRIYRSRVEAFTREEAPAIVIEPGIDRAVEFSSCKLDWTLELIIAIYTRGQIPDQLADPIVVDVNTRLMTDRSLGGLAIDILPAMVDPQRDKADLTSLWTVLTYRVRYRTDDVNLAA